MQLAEVDLQALALLTAAIAVQSWGAMRWDEISDVLGWLSQDFRRLNLIQVMQKEYKDCNARYFRNQNWSSPCDPCFSSIHTHIKRFFLLRPLCSASDEAPQGVNQVHSKTTVIYASCFVSFWHWEVVRKRKVCHLKAALEKSTPEVATSQGKQVYRMTAHYVCNIKKNYVEENPMQSN